MARKKENIEKRIKAFDQAGLNEDWGKVIEIGESLLADLADFAHLPNYHKVKKIITAKLAPAYNNQGNVYLEQKQYNQVIANYTQAITISPKFAGAYYNRGIAYDDLKQYDKAIADFDQAIALDPNYAAAYNNRGNVYDNLKQYDKAIADFDQAIALDPNNARAYVNRGNAYSNLKQYDQAIADFNQAMALEPDYANAYNGRGSVYDNLKQYDQAIVDYTKAIEINPNFEEPYNNRGIVYDNLKKYEQAIADFNQAIMLNLDYAEAYYNRAIYYVRQKQYDKAIADFDQAIALDLNNAGAYNNRGAIYLEQEQYKKAIADYTKAIKINPEYTGTYYDRGYAYYQLKRYDKAIADYNQAIALNPDDAHAYFNRALSYIRQEQYGTALKESETIIEKFPKSYLGYQSKGVILLVQGYETEAEKWFDKAVNFISKGFKEEYLINTLETAKQDHIWLKGRESVGAVFDLDNDSFDLHERVLFAYARLENALRFFLFYHLHYILKCDAERVRALLLKDTKLRINGFLKIFKIFLDKLDEKDRDKIGDLNKLEELFNRDEVIEKESKKDRDLIYLATTARNKIAHGKSFSTAQDRSQWENISDVNNNECYFALYMFLQFYIDLQKIFAEHFRLAKGQGSDYNLFQPSPDDLDKNKYNILDKDETEEILKKLKPEKS